MICRHKFTTDLIQSIYKTTGLSSVILLFQIGKGLLRALCCKRYGIFDLVPVDLVNNMVLSIGWITSVDETPHRQPPVYHCNSGSHNPITYRRLCKDTMLTYNPLLYNGLVKYLYGLYTAGVYTGVSQISYFFKFLFSLF